MPRRNDNQKILMIGLGFVIGLNSAGCPAQTVPLSKVSDPFERYLRGVTANYREPSMLKFAAECGIDVHLVKAKYAVSAGGGWTPVNSLQKGLKSIESDFYTTAEAWKIGNHIMVEMWPNSDDVGEETRTLYCFESGELKFAETVQWSVPVEQNPKIKPWGFSRRWQSNNQKRLQLTHSEFVDEYERNIAKPKLDAEDEKDLQWSPPLGPLPDHKFPDIFLK